MGLVKHPARVVIMDIHLPGIDGVECVRQLAPICRKRSSSCSP